MLWEGLTQWSVLSVMPRLASSIGRPNVSTVVGLTTFAVIIAWLAVAAYAIAYLIAH